MVYVDLNPVRAAMAQDLDVDFSVRPDNSTSYEVVEIRFESNGAESVSVWDVQMRSVLGRRQKASRCATIKQEVEQK
jgi:hypothetical protein